MYGTRPPAEQDDLSRQRPSEEVLPDVDYWITGYMRPDADEEDLREEVPDEPVDQAEVDYWIVRFGR